MKNWEDALKCIEEIREKAKGEIGNNDLEYNTSMSILVGMTYTLAGALKGGQLKDLAVLMRDASEVLRLSSIKNNPERN